MAVPIYPGANLAMVAAPAQNRGMGRKRSLDRHAENWPVRIPIAIANVLDELGKRNATSAATEARRLIREGLEREGLWPPKTPEQSRVKKQD